MDLPSIILDTARTKSFVPLSLYREAAISKSLSVLPVNLFKSSGVKSSLGLKTCSVLLSMRILPSCPVIFLFFVFHIPLVPLVIVGCNSSIVSPFFTASLTIAISSRLKGIPTADFANPKLPKLAATCPAFFNFSAVKTLIFLAANTCSI